MLVLVQVVGVRVCLAAVADAARADAGGARGVIALDRGLTIADLAEVGRRPINTDAVVAALVDGALDLAAVKAGDELQPGHAWREVTAGADGAVAPIGRSTYVLWRVPVDAPRVMLLHATGHAMVYVNGEPRVGDPYAHGYVTLPVALRGAGKGEGAERAANSLLFAHAGRGPMRAELRPLPDGAQVLILERDLTLPDAIEQSQAQQPIGVPLLNASERSRTVTLHAQAAGGAEHVSEPITLVPLGVHKAMVRVDIPGAAAPLGLTMIVRDAKSGEELARHTATLRVPAAADSPRSITYASRVDGSAQYIAIVPPKVETTATGAPGLVLSLHGASVEATSQAGAYAPRAGLLIACPTNRRPFGFDWEDWGRIDAIESMDEVARRYGTDPARQYLTGHSMGGHGTWNIGTLHPERFAAIAPSAGWLSFDTYTSRGGPTYAPPGALGEVFRRARASSDTLALMANLRGKGVYILHGDADDNVPVDQARQARAALDALGISHQFHEQPGAGHWWDDDQPGAACVDWPGIWEMFAAHRLPDKTVPPAVAPPLDARGFPLGSFKRAFDRGFVLVYGTGGTAEENAWSLAKARFDAEQWWVRGNGRAVVMADTQFNLAPTDGNVVLYGHADANRAWAGVVGEGAPVHVARGVARIGRREVRGEDLAVLTVLPRVRGAVGTRDGTRIEDGALVGVIAGAGASGARATERLGIFTSGIGWPDVTLLHAAAWRTGFTGVRAAGALNAGEGSVVWREEAGR